MSCSTELSMKKFYNLGPSFFVQNEGSASYLYRKTTVFTVIVLLLTFSVRFQRLINN